MRAQALLLLSFTFSLEVLAKGRGGGGRGGGGIVGGSPVGSGRYSGSAIHRDSLGHLGASYSCSADTSDATPDDFADDIWKPQVLGCLNMMNSSLWNGVHCQPVHSDGVTPYGVSSYGFYKSNSNQAGAGQQCFDVCAPCIMKGINAGRAVTTHCDYNWGVHGAARHRCGMGFDWGDAEYEAKHDCSATNLCKTTLKPDGE